MTREQAINYLRSSGMSDEQIKSVSDAFNGTNGIRELIRKFDDKHTPYAITQEYKDLTISQIIEYMVDIDDLLENITYELMEVEDEET